MSILINNYLLLLCFSDYISYCNFNDNARPLCDWKQSYGELDQADWIRAKGNTPTLATGPNGDYPDGCKINSAYHDNHCSFKREVWD